MRILLDESVPKRFAGWIQGHEVRTVQQQGWKGLANGALLTEAQDHFDVLVTVDRSLPFQQDIRKYGIGVVILAARSNRLEDLEPLLPALHTAVAETGAGEWVIIGGLPRREE